MERKGNNYYQTCRILAGFTQEKAAEKLGISVSSLAKYETDTRIPPDDVVDHMADVYNSPLLAWWHLREHNPLGHRLPEVQMPQSDGDMAMQSILMEDSIKKANKKIMHIMADGVITDDELAEFNEYKNLIKITTDRGSSISIYQRK